MTNGFDHRERFAEYARVFEMGNRRTAAVALLLFVASSAIADPVKLQPIDVTASWQYPGNGPGNAVDGNSSTLWNSGGVAPQWIRLDLGKTLSIRKIRLQVAQSPTGYTNHSVAVGADLNHLRTVYTYNNFAYDGQWIEFSGDGAAGDKMGNVRYVQITTTSSPSWVAWKEIEVYGGLEYFGYWGDAIAWASGDAISDTVAAGANVVWIGPNTTDDLANKLSEARSRGVKAIIDPQYLLFPGNVGPSMYDDWQTRWAQIAGIINYGGYQSTVAAFYLMDEPTINNVSAGVLGTLAARIKQDFPATPRAVIFDWGSIGNGAFLPYLPFLEWVGFDRYAYWSEGIIPTTINTLRSSLSSEQRMIAVPCTYVPVGPFSNSSTTTQNALIEENINYWHREILGDGKYVMVAPFLWSYFSFTGGRDLWWPGDSGSVRSVSSRMHQLAYSFLPPSSAYQVFPVDYSASASWSADTVPFVAFDLNQSTGWSSGGYAPQSINAIFGGSTRIGKVQLVVAQYPAGTATHQLWGLRTDNNWQLMGTLQGDHDGQTLTWSGAPIDATSIQVVTTSSPSWVGWRDIQFFRQ